MIERLVTLCFNRRGIVVLVFVLVALYGGYAWTQLPLEAYPDIADTTSQVVTQVNGLVDAFKVRTDALAKALAHENGGPVEKHARYMRDKVVPAMSAVRLL